MPGFYSQEYHDLVAAQKVLSQELESPPEKSATPMLARALVDVIQLKRKMRGLPDPRPVEVEDPRKRRKRGADQGSGSAAPTDGPFEPPA